MHASQGMLTGNELWEGSKLFSIEIWVSYISHYPSSDPGVNNLLNCCPFCSGKLPFTVLAIDSASNYVEVRDPRCRCKSLAEFKSIYGSELARFRAWHPKPRGHYNLPIFQCQPCMARSLRKNQICRRASGSEDEVSIRRDADIS